MSSATTLARVFICHQHEDKAFARKIASDLERAGFKTWVDEAEILVGDSLVTVISDAIDDVDFVAALVSRSSQSSAWVRKELELAMTKEICGRKVVVLPLKLEDCEMPVFLRDKLYADFSRGTYAGEFDRLVRSIRGHLERQSGAAKKDYVASSTPMKWKPTPTDTALAGPSMSTPSRAPSGSEGTVFPVDKGLIEDFCDQLHFTSQAKLRSWCIIHDSLGYDDLMISSDRIYNSRSLANVTRTLLHKLNGTAGFGTKPNSVLFWQTVERIAELTGFDKQTARELLVAAVDGPHPHTQYRRAVPRAIDDSALFGQLAQLINFLGPFGPARSTFSVPSDWYSFAAAYGAVDLVGGIDDRLLRSQRFQDPDYPSEVNELLQKLSDRSRDQAISMCYALACDLMPQLEKQPAALQKQAHARFPSVFLLLEDLGT